MWGFPRLGFCHHTLLPRDDLDGQILYRLFSCAERQAEQPGAMGLLVQMLEQSDWWNMAQEVQAVLELNRHKYQDGISTQAWPPGALRHLAFQHHSPQNLPWARPANFRLAPDVPRWTLRSPYFQAFLMYGDSHLSCVTNKLCSGCTHTQKKLQSHFLTYPMGKNQVI